MKVKHVLMITAVMLAMLAMPVAADTVVTHSVTESYEVSIPESLTVGTAGTIGISGLLDANTQVKISVASANTWELKLGNKDSLSYKLYEGDSAISNYDKVLVAKAEELASSGEKTLSATAKLDSDAEPKYRGDYTDVLTFTVTQEAVDGTSVLVSSYEELKSAFTDGKSILLINNIEIPNDADGLTVASGKTVTLNLNGHTISQKKAQTAAYAMITVKGTLTIADSIGSGAIRYEDTTVYNADPGWASNTIKNEGTLVIDGGSIISDSSANVASYGYPHAIDTYQGSSTTINGGTVDNEIYDAIRMFCNSGTENNAVTITGGTIKGRVSLQHPSANIVAKGSLTITGGEFITSDNVNANVRYLNFGNDHTNMMITVSGGTFDKGIKINDYANSNPALTFDFLGFTLSGITQLA